MTADTPAAPGVTKEVEAELPPSVRDAVVYLVAASYDAGKHGATDSSSVRDATEELGFVLACALQRKDAEIERLQISLKRYEPVSLYNGKSIETYAKELESSRAENTALAKELRSFTEAARSWHQCHHTSAEIQCDWFCECMLRAEPLLALRAGQQKG